MLPAGPDPLPPPHEARAGDLPALLALEQAAFAGDRMSARQYRRHLGSDSTAVRVVREHGELLGSAVLFFRRGSTVARLYSIATAARARGRGVGAALLQDALRLARERGCTALRLEVRTDNAAAIGLYERHGFTRFGCHRGYYEDGADAWRYQRALD